MDQTFPNLHQNLKAGVEEGPVWRSSDVIWSVSEWSLFPWECKKGKCDFRWEGSKPTKGSKGYNLSMLQNLAAKGQFLIKCTSLFSIPVTKRTIWREIEPRESPLKAIVSVDAWMAELPHWIIGLFFPSFTFYHFPFFVFCLWSYEFALLFINVDHNCARKKRITKARTEFLDNDSQYIRMTSHIS